MEGDREHPELHQEWSCPTAAQGCWKKGWGQCDSPAQAARQWGGRGMLKRQLWAPPGVPAEGDGSDTENRPEKFWGLAPAEALGKELELQEGELVAHSVIAMFVPTPGVFQGWRRAAHGRSRGALPLA